MEIFVHFFVVTLLFFIVISLAVIFIAMMWANISGAPFVITTDPKLATMLELVKIKKGQKVVDLGSGNGKIVIALAKLGAEAHGYEVNPLLVWWSRRNIRNAGLENKAIIHWKDLFLDDLSGFEVVTLYGISTMMARLEKKLDSELKIGSKVVSNYFRFPNWKPSLEKDKVLVYIKGNGTRSRGER